MFAYNRMAKHCHQRIGDYKMALTRTILEAMGIEEKKIDEIISAHAETMSALKQQRDNYKAQADELAEVQRKLDEANETIKANDSDAWKVKYDAIKEEYDNYKSDISAKETTRAKQAAYRITQARSCRVRYLNSFRRLRGLSVQPSFVFAACQPDNSTLKKSTVLFAKIFFRILHFLPLYAII